ncbi:methionine biosynthesis protein MetW, partial [Oleiphilus sp. HI0067]
MRGDLEIISPWVSQASTVLDMGCGDGLLLAHLQSEKGVKGYGLEIDEDRITECIVNGVNVV